MALSSSRLESGLVLLTMVAVGPAVALITGDVYQLAMFERAMIYAIAAVSLNMILGFGGMVSFGHAVYLGIGCYATGILANEGITEIWLQLPIVIVASALVALFIGLIVLRTTGVYFIMITLALAQIFYFLAVSSSYFGGDDGMVIFERTTLPGAYDPFDSWQFYAFTAAITVLCILLVNRVIRSDFGRRLVACRENSTRATALGFNVFVIRLVSFVLAGAICGIAGFLLANQTEFATPGYASWHRSGELLVIVILGGVGTRFGPVYGAFAFVLLETVLANYTNHWPILFGPFLILVVLFFRQGLAGIVDGSFRTKASAG